MLSLSGYDLPTDQVVQTLLDIVTTSGNHDDAEVQRLMKLSPIWFANSPVSVRKTA